MLNWDKYQKKIREAFKKDGVSAVLSKKVYGEYDVATGVSAETTPEQETVHAFIKSDDYKNDFIAADEIIIMCSAPKEMDISFPENHFITIKGKEYPINRSKASMPGGTELFYKLYCKR